MTPQELKEIEERCEKATPGPWRVKYQAHTLGASIRVDSPKDPTDDYLSMSPRNLEFIAHARTDIPRLIACVREMEAALREAQETIHSEFCSSKIHHRQPCRQVLAFLQKFDEGDRERNG